MSVPTAALADVLGSLSATDAEVVRAVLARYEHDVQAATQRAELAEAVSLRLREVQEAVRRLSRSLGEAEVASELGAQVARLVGADIVAVQHVSLDAGRLRTLWRQVKGAVLARDEAALEPGPVLEAARSGRTRGADGPTPAGVGLDDLDHDTLQRTVALVVPMLAGQRLEGVLTAVWVDGFPPAWAQDVLEAMAAHGAATLRNARLYQESERERRQSEALADAAAAVGESLRVGEVQRLILRHAMALLRSEGAWIGLLDDRYVHVVAGVGSAAVLTGRLIPHEGTLEGRVVRDRVPEIVRDADEAQRLFRPVQRAANIRRAVLVPMITARGVVGVLAANDRGTPFTEDDVRTLQRLADQCAVAVFNARLFEEARAATQEWKVVFDAVPSGVVVVDETGRIVRFNARALLLAGHEGGQATLLGQSLAAVLTGTAEGHLPQPVADALATGAVCRGRIVAAAQGRVFDLLCSPHPEGGVVVTFDDVSDLHALEQQHRSVLETASDAIVVTSTARRLAFANPAACDLFGDEGLEGRLVEELLPPDQREAVRRHEDAAFAGDRTRYETVVRAADGELRTVSVHSAPLRGPDGVVWGIVSSLRDVTDERRARDATAKSEARYRNLFEHANDAIYTLDVRGLVTSANAAAAEITGTPAAELLGRPVTPFIAPDEASMVAEQFRRARGGEAVRFEARVVRPDGTTRLASVVNTPIRLDGEVRGVIGILRDVTDERRMQEQLTLQERLAAIGELVSGVAHELNNPLAGVLAHAQLLLAVPGLDADVQDAAEVIQGEAKRAARIVSQLLTFARQRAQQRGITDLGTVVRDTLALRRYPQRMAGIECTVTMPDALPPTWADEGQLQQVVLNLVVNAEHALEGRPAPRRIALRLEGDDARLVLEVSDNGPGIPAEVQPRIFHPFFTTKPVGKGTGLGLSLVDGIVREHGGTIGVTSDGTGTTFRIELPRLDPPVPRTAEHDGGRPLRVLVADPDAESRRLVARALAEAGDAVLTLGDPDDVVRAASARDWDIVLLDAAWAARHTLVERLAAEAPAAAGRIVGGGAGSGRPAAFEARPWIDKPYDLASLAGRLRGVTA